ncbi:MAG: glycosyltransferase [Actinobacteria bacterium]|nr:glycosyltransferase [Actinomycetota bacterium]
MQRASGVVVDVRALQAHDHASRGIGRYTFELITAIEQRDPTLVRAFVADPMFPMHEQMLRLLPTGKLRRSDDPEFTAHPPRVFHVTSPFVEGDMPAVIVPAWARGTDTFVVATVYDLIPARFPEIYLSDPAIASIYHARHEFLRTCDSLFAISEATSMDFQELLGIPADRVVTIHGAAAPQFSGLPAAKAEQGELVTLEDLRRAVLSRYVATANQATGYVLCPTGAEWRKNLDRLLQAWATLSPALRTSYPLVVQCHLQPDAREHLLARSAELGIAAQVVFTGAVSDAELIELLRGASLVVFPSVYEGLGLPILEAQACGAAVICGNNSSLKELVSDPSARFDAESVPDIARVIERFLLDPAARQELAATAVEKRYQWSEVARLVADTYKTYLDAPFDSELIDSARQDAGVARPFRLALASPIPPQLCGPAGYFADLVKYLPDLCELTVFTTLDPAEVQLPREVRVERLDALEVIEAIEGPFDEVLYFLGNSEFHIGELLQLQRRPGAVFLHDARLTILYTEMHRRYPHLMGETFGQALHRMYPGRYPSAVGGAQFLPLAEEGTYGILMVADVANVATRLFVHSEHAADLIELDCGRRPEVLFPIPCPVAEQNDAERNDAERSDAPAESGSEKLPGRPLIASFGFVSPAKRSELLVDLMQDLTQADLALVGNSGEDFLEELRTAAQAQGTTDQVTATGKVTSSEYQDWLSRTTVAVQLRWFSNGESSASVGETLAAGIPTVVTDIGTFSEYPDDTVVKLPRNISSEALATALSDLLADEARLAALSAAGKAYAARNTYELAANKLVSELSPPTVNSGS